MKHKMPSSPGAIVRVQIPMASAGLTDVGYGTTRCYRSWAQGWFVGYSLIHP